MTGGSNSVIWLLAANLVPLAGVVFMGWSLLAVLLLYWLESAVVGGYNVLRMRKVERGPELYYLVPFFIVHYGIFMFVHLVFVVALFGKGANVPQVLSVVWLPVLAFVISHGVSYRQNFIGRGEYKRLKIKQVMMRPYGRIVVMHLTVLFGGWLVMLFGAPVGALVIMVLVKTGIDLRAHQKAHA